MVSPAKDKHQTPTQGLKLYAKAVIESESWVSWPTIVQLKKKPQL